MSSALRDLLPRSPREPSHSILSSFGLSATSSTNLLSAMELHYLTLPPLASETSIEPVRPAIGIRYSPRIPADARDALQVPPFTLTLALEPPDPSKSNAYIDVVEGEGIQTLPFPSPSSFASASDLYNPTLHATVSHPDTCATSQFPSARSSSFLAVITPEVYEDYILTLISSMNDGDYKLKVTTDTDSKGKVPPPPKVPNTMTTTQSYNPYNIVSKTGATLLPPNDATSFALSSLEFFASVYAFISPSLPLVGSGRYEIKTSATSLDVIDSSDTGYDDALSSYSSFLSCVESNGLPTPQDPGNCTLSVLPLPPSLPSTTPMFASLPDAQLSAASSPSVQIPAPQPPVLDPYLSDSTGLDYVLAVSILFAFVIGSTIVLKKTHIITTRIPCIDSCVNTDIPVIDEEDPEEQMGLTDLMGDNGLDDDEDHSITEEIEMNHVRLADLRQKMSPPVRPFEGDMDEGDIDEDR